MDKLTNEQLKELLQEAVFVAECFQRAFEGKRVTNIPHVSEALKRIQKLIEEPVS